MPLHLNMRRDGKTLIPSGELDAKLLERLPENRNLTVKASQPRSNKAQNYYHHVIQLAADHWPHGVEPEPEGDKELLRAWLECMAGPKWRNTRDFPPEMAGDIVWLMRELAGSRYAFVKAVETEEGPKLRVYVPKSTKYHKMDEAEFTPLRDEVFRIIEGTLDVTVQQLVIEAEQTA